MGNVNSVGVYEYDRTDGSIGPALFNLQAAALTSLFGDQTPITMVANTTARGLHANDYASKRGAITNSNPCVVWRADAPAGKQLEFTVDGSTWGPVNAFDATSLEPYLQSGTHSMTTVASSTVNDTVTFKRPFAVPPVIQLTSGSLSPQSRFVGYGSVTTTDFRIYLHSVTTVTMNVAWTATLPTS